jgi:hypothetical protein
VFSTSVSCTSNAVELAETAAFFRLRVVVLRGRAVVLAVNMLSELRSVVAQLAGGFVHVRQRPFASYSMVLQSHSGASSDKGLWA